MTFSTNAQNCCIAGLGRFEPLAELQRTFERPARCRSLGITENLFQCRLGPIENKFAKPLNSLCFLLVSGLILDAGAA
jgi:hypothetical protein